MNFKSASNNIFGVVSGKIKPEFLRKQNGIKNYPFLLIEYGVGVVPFERTHYVLVKGDER